MVTRNKTDRFGASKDHWGAQGTQPQLETKMMACLLMLLCVQSSARVATLACYGGTAADVILALLEAVLIDGMLRANIDVYHYLAPDQAALRCGSRPLVAYNTVTEQSSMPSCKVYKAPEPTSARACNQPEQTSARTETMASERTSARTCIMPKVPEPTSAHACNKPEQTSAHKVLSTDEPLVLPGEDMQALSIHEPLVLSNGEDSMTTVPFSSEGPMTTLLSNGDEDAATMVLLPSEDTQALSIYEPLILPSEDMQALSIYEPLILPSEDLKTTQPGVLLALDGESDEEMQVVDAMYACDYDGESLMHYKPDLVDPWDYFRYLTEYCTDAQINCIATTGRPSDDETIEQGMIENECSEVLCDNDLISTLDEFDMEGTELVVHKPKGVSYAEYASYLINGCDGDDIKEIIATGAAPSAHTSDKSEEAFAVAVVLIGAGVDIDIDTVLSVMPDGNVGADTAREFAAMSADERAAIMDDGE